MNARGLQLFAEPVQASDGLSLRFSVEGDGRVWFEKVINPNDQDAVIKLCNELVEVTGQRLTDVEQGVAELVAGQRVGWMRQRAPALADDTGDDDQAGALPPFLAVDDRNA